MKSTNVLKRLLTSVLLVLTGSLVASAQSHLVISQIYGGGGNGDSTKGTAATYLNDYVELYNPTANAISLSGYALQYGSGSASTPQGTFTGLAPLDSTKSVMPHHYYLVQLASQAKVGAALPAPDDTPPNPFNMGTAAGKVALTSSTTVLTACTGPTVVDFVGYGSTAACSETAPYSPPSGTVVDNTTAFSRSVPPVDTDNNSVDFSVVAANPHNSSYTSGGGTVTTLGIASSSATPSSVTAGSPIAFSVTVTPGSTSTGITVVGDLSSIGGSNAQAFTADSTGTVFTYSTSVGASIAANTYSIPVKAADTQGGTASGSISLTVQSTSSSIPISTIQANRATYVGTKVTTSGVITLIAKQGYYMQTYSSTPGATGVEGLYVFTNSAPSGVAVGDQITVTGTLSLYPSSKGVIISHTPTLELGSPAISSTTHNQQLPPPIKVTSITPDGGIYQLTKYESMLVTIPSLTAVSGTDASLAESTETTTSTGQFYTVITGTARPFREPGIDFRDFPTATCPTITNCTATATSAGVTKPTNVTLYDDNPERLIVESSLGGGTTLDVSSGAVITNATGVIDFSYSTDVPYGDPARLILQPGSVANFTPGLVVNALPVPGAGKFTVAAYNIERFFNTNAADNLYYDPVSGTTKTSSAVNVTADAYARRLKKVSLGVRKVLNSPDIISFEEAENLSVLKDIATQIDTDAVADGGTAPGYIAYGTDSVSTFTDDIGGISIGFLVKPSTVNVVAFEQMGAKTTYQNASNQAATLNDRPSDVLHAGIKRGAGLKDYPITVISNHLRSLNDVNDDVNVRTKKELQAEMLANLIQGYQSNGEHVIAVGDMNAFQFSDGYTDVLGTITGNVGMNVAAQSGKAIVSPAAVDLVTTLPAAQQQSYVEWGNAQVLDHVVVTADIANSTTLAYAHINSDFPVVLYNDPTTPAASSDHDPALAYLTIPAAVTTGALTGTGTFTSQAVGTMSAGQQFMLTNAGDTAIAISNIATTGDFAQTNNCGASLAISTSCMINVVFKPTATGSRTGTLTVTSNASGIAAANLTGTGTPAPDFTFGGSGSGPTSLAVAAGGSVSTTITVNSTNGFSGSLAFTCTPGGTAGTGVTCTVTSPVIVPAGQSGTATVTFNTTTRTVSSSGLGSLPTSTGGRLACSVMLLISGIAFATLRRGRRNLIALTMLLFGLVMGVSGCSSSLPTSTTVSGTPAGTYTYNVTATSGSTSHTQAITLTVQ